MSSLISHFPGFPTFFPSAHSLLYSFILLNDGILHCLVLSFLLPPGHCTYCFLFLEHSSPSLSPSLVRATHLPGCILDFTSSKKSLTSLPHPNYNRSLFWPTCTRLGILEYVFPSSLSLPIIGFMVHWGNCLTVCLASSKKVRATAALLAVHLWGCR